MAKLTSRKRRRNHEDHLLLMAKRGFLQALDTHAYEKAYEEIRDDPEVQEAMDVLLDKLAAAFRRRAARKGRGSRAEAG
jgi:hypothetical protein